MARSFIAFLILAIVVATAPWAQAQDAARAVIDRAIQALGGEQSLNRLQAGHTRSKGTFEVAGGLDFTQENFFQLPDRFKEIQDIQGPGQKVTAMVGLSGDDAWMTFNGVAQPIDKNARIELQEAAYLLRVTRLTSLKKPSFHLTPLADIRVDGHPAAGVKVSAQGHRDIRLYFAKDSGLLVKVERQAMNPATKQEVAEERYYTEYREIDSLRTPWKIRVVRDGKPFLKGEMVEVKFLAAIDPGIFYKP
jgi:hypothetical protein